MIKLSEGELLDLLPSQMKNDTDMICLSYAIKCAIERLMVYEKQTMTDNFIDSLPENILDVLAVELRSPYYLQSMDIETKRSIIKNTLIWHTKAGTPSAVSEMITAIFGEGSLVEWFDFTEGEKTPGYFDIVTNARMTEDIVNSFMQIIKRVKNERSHIRRILINRKVEHPEWVGWGATSSPKRPVTNSPSIGRAIESDERSGAMVSASPKLGIANGYPGRKAEAAIRRPAAVKEAARWFLPISAPGQCLHPGFPPAFLPVLPGSGYRNESPASFPPSASPGYIHRYCARPAWCGGKSDFENRSPVLDRPEGADPKSSE